MVGVQRTTGKIMSHKLKAIKEKTKARRSCSTVLLPGHWALLRVAKLLHNFANRYTTYAELTFCECLTGASANQSGQSFFIRRFESDGTRRILYTGGLLRAECMHLIGNASCSPLFMDCVRHPHSSFASRDNFSSLESVR